MQARSRLATRVGRGEDAQRDEYEAMREGLRDLVRLLRYERRAWSRRKRAVRAFMAIKLANQCARARLAGQTAD